MKQHNQSGTHPLRWVCGLAVVAFALAIGGCRLSDKSIVVEPGQVRGEEGNIQEVSSPPSPAPQNNTTTRPLESDRATAQLPEGHKTDLIDVSDDDTSDDNIPPPQQPDPATYLPMSEVEEPTLEELKARTLSQLLECEERYRKKGCVPDPPAVPGGGAQQIELIELFDASDDNIPPPQQPDPATYLPMSEVEGPPLGEVKEPILRKLLECEARCMPPVN